MTPEFLLGILASNAEHLSCADPVPTAQKG